MEELDYGSLTLENLRELCFYGNSYYNTNEDNLKLFCPKLDRLVLMFDHSEELFIDITSKEFILNVLNSIKINKLNDLFIYCLNGNFSQCCDKFNGLLQLLLNGKLQEIIKNDSFNITLKANHIEIDHQNEFFNEFLTNWNKCKMYLKENNKCKIGIKIEENDSQVFKESFSFQNNPIFINHITFDTCKFDNHLVSDCSY